MNVDFDTIVKIDNYAKIYRLTQLSCANDNRLMNILIIFGIAAGCILAERLWPAMELPRVRAWWGRVLLINSIQFGITVLAGQTWNHWLNHASIFHLKDHLGDWPSALIIYVFSTFVYYWWHRARHDSQFLWRMLHQIHHSARRLEIVTSFYKHPLEIWINSILSSLIVYPLFGGSVRAAGYYTVLIALGEFFYHWNIKTPAWLGFIFQRHAGFPRPSFAWRRKACTFAFLADMHRLFKTVGMHSLKTNGFLTEHDETIRRNLRGFDSRRDRLCNLCWMDARASSSGPNREAPSGSQRSTGDVCQ